MDHFYIRQIKLAKDIDSVRRIKIANVISLRTIDRFNFIYIYKDRESDQHYHSGHDLEGAEQYSMNERISDEEDSINETEDKQELQQDPPNDDGANNYVDDVAKMEEMVCTVEEASARRGDVSQP